MRKAAVALVVVLVIGAAAAVFTRTTIWGRLYDPFKGYPGEEQFVIVAPGTGTAAIGRRLVEAGIVQDELAFRAALWWTGRARALQAGE
jgi:cell division protein YceG involved in septum cleavage